METLSPTGRVILGMLGLRPMSGYEIKTLVDHSTRFFWAASYGQIYPELRRLTEAGLIEGEEQAQGDRKRTVHRLTAAGREALEGWLEEPPEIHETRDESMLKVFFADGGDSGAVEATLAAKRDHHLEVVERLRAIQESGGPKPGESCERSLRLGIALEGFIAQWCERELADVRREARRAA